MALVEPLALGVVLVPAVLATCAAHGVGGLLGALWAGCGVDRAHGVADAIALLTLARCLRATAAIGVIVGVMTMLANLDDPTAIGPAIAAALASALYGLIGAERVVVPMASRLERGEEAAPPAA